MSKLAALWNNLQAFFKAFLDRRRRKRKEKDEDPYIYPHF